MNRYQTTGFKVITSIMLIVSTISLCSAAAELVGERLPGGIVPVDYELDLHPDIDALTFRAKVRISIVANVESPDIVLNAKGLEFDQVVLDEGQIGTVLSDPKLERASFKFAQPVATGSHTLTINYHGVISRNTFGLFAMDYKTDAGPQRILATSFEPAGERRLMPSWDEPGYKATFSLTVDAPTGRLAVSNMPVESIQPLSPTINRVHFYRSPKMSTYLMFLTIGDYERITDKVGDTETGVVVKRGDTVKAKLALDYATQLISYYNDYFGVPYPLPKLDLIAAPGNMGAGAMENWGANFYSQTALLFDPNSSTESDRQRVFQVVSHEMAHQWFGDLVTMAWWDNLWLNEGFARWMQTKVADDLHPDWKTGIKAMQIADRGKRADADPITHPVEQAVNSASEAQAAFDHITYDKGATVIRMIEDYVGADAFRDGIRTYMKSHAYGSAVSDDLWVALEQSSGKPIRVIARDFTLQPGLPLIYLSTKKNGHSVLELTQGVFRTEQIKPNQPFIWHIPLAVQSLSNGIDQKLLLDTEKLELSNVSFPLLVNSGQTSYVRVRYDQASYRALAQHFSDLAPIDQISILQDALALAQTGTIPVSVVFDFINSIPTNGDPLVWSQCISIFSALDINFAGLPVQTTLRRFARTRLNPVLARLGWDSAGNELPTITTLRPQLIGALSQFDDNAVIGIAKQRFADILNNQSKLRPEERQIVEAIVAEHADEAMFNTLIKRVQAVNDPLTKHQRLFALANVTSPALAADLLKFTLSPDVPAGENLSLLVAIGKSHPDLAWTFTIEHIKSPELKLGDSGGFARIVLISIVANSRDPLRINELKSYGENFLPSGSKKVVTNAISKIRMNSAMAIKYSSQATAWLAHNAAQVK
jgi:aminopeptidase N